MDKPTPKYKKDDIVYDREMHVEYAIVSFAWYQLNQEVWYKAKVRESGAPVLIAESWLTLIERSTYRKRAKGLDE